jgi:hypothetical protein
MAPLGVDFGLWRHFMLIKKYLKYKNLTHNVAFENVRCPLFLHHRIQE